MADNSDEPMWLDYFTAGVPTGEYFRLTLEDLAALCDTSSTGISRVNEVCYIGLIAYFEAFCKDHFASILNIEPTLIERLRQNGYQVEVDPSRLLDFPAEWFYRLGFLISELYDFGTPQRVNALYTALLKVTPFSKDEMKFYERMLADRNLLVHHGGTYTYSYVSQAKLEWKTTGHGPYFGSLVVTGEYLNDRIEFVRDLALKMLKGTHGAMNAYLQIRGIEYTGEKQKALDAFLYWSEA